MKTEYPVSNLIFEKLRQYREAANMSQTELAARMQCLGIPLYQQAISKIERNRRYVLDYELLGFCRVLHVRPENLMPKQRRIPD